MDKITQWTLSRLLTGYVLKENAVEETLAGFPLADGQRRLARGLFQKKLKYFELLQNYDYSVVSLGVDCFPRTIPTRWGIKPTRGMGGATMPFDLAVHPLSAVLWLFENDFRGYRPDSIRTGAENYLVHSKLNIVHNHDPVTSPPKGVFGNKKAKITLFDAFEKVLAERVRNMVDTLTAGNSLAVICVRENMMAGGAGGRAYTLDALRTIRDKVRSYADTNELVCVVMADKDDHVLDSIPYCHTFVRPHKGYVWFDLEEYLTEQGVAVETRTIDYLADIITGNMPLRSSPRFDESVYDLYEKSGSLNMYFSRVCLQNNDLEGAIEKVRKAIASQEKNPSYHNHLASMLTMSGEHAAAEQERRKASDLSRPLLHHTFHP